jgi:hypothetical protein
MLDTICCCCIILCKITKERKWLRSNAIAKVRPLSGKKKKYGKNVRIATPKLKVQGRQSEYTCTVCGTKTTNVISE